MTSSEHAPATPDADPAPAEAAGGDDGRESGERPPDPTAAARSGRTGEEQAEENRAEESPS